MNFSDAIRLKRAVRKFTPEPLPEETILAILNAGRRAQSSKNTQPWHFIAITDKAVLKQLSECGEWAGHLAGAALFAVVPWSGTGSGLTGLPLDDSWIHLVYARAVSTLDGFAYNAGQAEAGFTSPLWIVMLAPLFWLQSLLHVPLVLGVKLLGLLLGVAASLLAFRLARRLTGLAGAGWTAT